MAKSYNQLTDSYLASNGLSRIYLTVDGESRLKQATESQIKAYQKKGRAFTYAKK